MQIERRYVDEGVDPFSLFEYEKHDCVIKHRVTGEMVFSAIGCEVPKHWSKNARDILVSKYFRRNGIPSDLKPVSLQLQDKGVIPDWLRRHAYGETSTFGGEKSVKQVIHRMVGHWAYTGWVNGYFEPDVDQLPHPTSMKSGMDPDKIINNLRDQNTKAFYDEVVYMMLNQMAAPNSPQFFNTGLWWAYGIAGEPQGHKYVNLPAITHHETEVDDCDYGDIESAKRALATHLADSPNAFEHVAAHACYIMSVEDNMLEENGILDWYTREARVFKFGSGSGANLSKLRGRNEPLSGGGFASGVMSWMEPADRNAGSIKSGGITRRAACMRILDLDHPDIVDFIGCKTKSEWAVASMVAGSALVARHCNAIMEACHGGGQVDVLCAKAMSEGVPATYVQKAKDLAGMGQRAWKLDLFDSDFEGAAYQIAPYQNSNNSVRIPSVFYKAVDTNGSWFLSNRTNAVKHPMDARALEYAIASDAWQCGDPGVQFDDTFNDWNTTPNDGRIKGTNPCGEFARLDGSACNLASLRLTKFFKDGKFDAESYIYSVCMWTLVLDITNSMAHLPDKQTAMSVYMYRDIGLGYADLGALLMSMGIPYASDQGRSAAAHITALHLGAQHMTSALMAKSLGAYPRFAVNREHHLRCMSNHMAVTTLFPDRHIDKLTNVPQYLRFDGNDCFDRDMRVHIKWCWSRAWDLADECGLRNASLCVIAPTGTIGFVMDCEATGIEPVYALQTFKSTSGGGHMSMTAADCVEKGLLKCGYDDETINQILQHIDETGTIPTGDTEEPFVAPEDVLVFQTAASNNPDCPAISWQDHVAMMAAVQPFVSGAISKTINMPAESTIDDVKQAFRMAHDTGCKSIAIYRDQSKLSQPLSIKAAVVVDKEATAIHAAPEKKLSPTLAGPRMKLGSIRTPGVSVAAALGPGTLYVHTDHYEDGGVAEIWATYSADQGIIQALISTLCRTANVSLQHGVPLNEIVRSWIHANFEPSGLVSGHPYIKTATSVVNLLARILEFHEMGVCDNLNVQPSMLETADTAVTTVQPITQLSGYSCKQCGQQLMRSGAGCLKCSQCGNSDGCG